MAGPKGVDMSVCEGPRPLGRRSGTLHGELRAAVLKAVCTEDHTNPLTDLAIAAGHGVSESAVSEARRTLGIPASRIRARAKSEWGVGYGLAYCHHCIRKYRVHDGHGGVQCPGGHGKLVLSDYALIPR